MLIQLAITPKNQRQTLQSDLDAYFSLPTLGHTDAAGNFTRIATLYSSHKSITIADIIQAILNTTIAITNLPENTPTSRLKASLQTLDDANWARLIVLHDQCTHALTLEDLSQTDALIQAAAQIAQDASLKASIRLNAFYFLRSQNEHNSLFDNAELLALIQEKHTDTTELTILLTRDDSPTAKMRETLNAIARKRTSIAPEEKSTDEIENILKDFKFFPISYKSGNLVTLLDATLQLQMHCLSGKASEITIEETQNRVEALFTRLQNEPNVPYEDNYKFAAFLLARLVAINEKIIHPKKLLDKISRNIASTVNQVKTGGIVVGKEAKTPLLRNIVEHLLKAGDFSTINTTEPFLWRIYAGEYLTAKAVKKDVGVTGEKAAFTAEKISDLNDWLKERILNHPNSDEVQALLKLPLVLRNQLFGYEGSVINPETLMVVPERRSSLSAGMYAVPRKANEASSAPPKPPKPVNDGAIRAQLTSIFESRTNAPSPAAIIALPSPTSGGAK